MHGIACSFSPAGVMQWSIGANPPATKRSAHLRAGSATPASAADVFPGRSRRRHGPVRYGVERRRMATIWSRGRCEGERGRNFIGRLDCRRAAQ